MEQVLAPQPTVAPYQARILPPEEWDRLPEEVRSAITPEGAAVIVVEAADGAIVARWVALNTIHLEGLYVDPDFRGNPVVARQLTTFMVDALRLLGVPQALTIIQDDRVRRMAATMGFVEVPGTIHHLTL